MGTFFQMDMPSAQQIYQKDAINLFYGSETNLALNVYTNAFLEKEMTFLWPITLRLSCPVQSCSLILNHIQMKTQVSQTASLNHQIMTLFLLALSIRWIGMKPEIFMRLWFYPSYSQPNFLHLPIPYAVCYPSPWAVNVQHFFLVGCHFIYSSIQSRPRKPPRIN